MIGCFQGFANNRPDCFEWSLSFEHVTGSVWGDQVDTHELPMLHRKLNQWFQLGGYIKQHLVSQNWGAYFLKQYI